MQFPNRVEDVNSTSLFSDIVLTQHAVEINRW